MMNLPSFKDKVAVVTGGSGVLCSQFCKVLAEGGAKVAIVGIDPVAGSRVENEIREAGFEATSFIMNVIDKDSIKKCHEEILAKYGKCDILINGAGGNNPKATTDEEFFTPESLTNDGIKGFFDIDLSSGWELSTTEEMVGYSHESILKEIYTKA